MLTLAKNLSKIDQNIVPYEVIQEEREKNKKSNKKRSKTNFPSNSGLTKK